MNTHSSNPLDIQYAFDSLVSRFGIMWEAGPYVVIEAPPEAPVMRYLVVKDEAGPVVVILEENLQGGDLSIHGDGQRLPTVIGDRIISFLGQIPFPSTASRTIVPPVGDDETLAWLADPEAPGPRWLATTFSAELFSVWRGDHLQLVVDRCGLPYDVAMDRLMAFGTPDWRHLRNGTFEDLPADTYRFQPVEDTGTWKTLKPRIWDETTPLSPRTKVKYDDLVARIAPLIQGRKCPSTELAAQREMAAIEKDYIERLRRRPVTPKQIEFIDVMAKTLGVSVPKAVFADRYSASKFITEHKEPLRVARRTPPPVVGQDSTTIDFPYPTRDFRNLRDVLDAYLSLPEVTDWEFGFPEVDGKGLEPYASVIRNARHALAGQTLRGLDLRVDMERFMLPGKLGVIRRPSIEMIADIVDRKNLFLSWTGTAEDYTQVWDLNTYVYGRTAILVYPSLVEMASYPGFERGSWESRSGNPELDAWCLEMVFWTMAEIALKLHPDFHVSNMPGFALHYHKPKGHPVKVAYNWSCVPPEFVVHARKASEVEGAVRMVRGVDLVHVMAEINRHRRNRKEIGAAEWPTSQRAGWKLLRRWMRDIRGLEDPDPQALVEDEEEDKLIKRARASEMARERKFLENMASRIKNRATEANISQVELLEALAPLEKGEPGPLLEALRTMSGNVPGMDGDVDPYRLVDILFNRRMRKRRQDD